MWMTFVQAILAGVYIAFGGTLSYSVGISPTLKASDPGLYKIVIGSFGLPFGLLIIVITGASLFTSNTMYMPLGYYHGRTTLRAWAANWFLSYFGNLVGTLLIAGTIKAAGVFEGLEDQIVVRASDFVLPTTSVRSP